MPFCVYCGSQEPAEAVFCSKCRQPLNRNDPTRTVNKPRAVNHQELISQSEEQASVLLTRQNVAPHAHDPSGYSGQQKRTRERDKHHRALHHGWTLTITLILIVALVVAAIVGALKFVPSVFHPGSNSPHQVTVTTYEVPGDSWDITAGPDGNFWFTEFGSGKIGRITPGGKATEFPLSNPNSNPLGITAGPDHNLWFTEETGNQIGRITPGGKITEFPLPTANSFPKGITAGPDGNLWFVEGSNRIGRITPGGQITEFPLSTPNSGPYGITAGHDGNLWFTEDEGEQIGRITPDGQITEFSLLLTTSETRSITAGPDGNLWFTEETVDSRGLFSGSKIGRITPSGQITEFPLSATNSGLDSTPITAGSDGNLWFTEEAVYSSEADGGNKISGSKIGRITPAGQITEFPLPTTISFLEGITVGPDGNLWLAGQTSKGKGVIVRMAP